MATGAERYSVETISAIHRWTADLFSFRITRQQDFRFVAGQYARLGFAAAAEIVWRPYSMVSASAERQLEFYSTIVPGGAFSTQLAAAEVGDEILVDRRSFGFLTLAAFADGRDLWMLASGTGLGPFVAILREAEVWRKFERLIVVHSVRTEKELAYRETIAALAATPPVAGADGRIATLRYLPVVTRETVPGALGERITVLLDDGRLEQHAGATIEPAGSRVMVCGNPELAKALRARLEARGLAISHRGAPGQLAFENYW
ncbi:MAG: ferredoxin--NADP reductase [Rhodocyclales bacterium]|nr:ferredoxin--NADP reductase [Rhodocyclales bacterium]